MASITPKNGRVAFVAAWDPDTYWELNSTNLGTNYGDDPTTSDNSAVAAGDISTQESYDGMNNQNDPPTGTHFDDDLTNDAAALVYIPSGLAHGTNYGLWSNGGGTNGQGGFLRATTTGVEIACNHCNGNDASQDALIYEIPDADLPGWFCISWQFNSHGGTEGDMALWINGTAVRSATRTFTLDWGSGNPDFGNAAHREPNQATVRDPSGYTGGDWGANTAITSSGILIANFTEDNPSGGASDTSAGNGNTWHTDYYSDHVESSIALDGGAGTKSYSFTGADVTFLYSEVLTSGAAAASYSFSGADTTTSSIEYVEGFEFDAFDDDAFASTAFDLEAGAASTPLTGGAASTSYSFAGADVSTLYNEYLAAAVDSYSFSGADTTTTTDTLTTAAVGTYALSGIDVTFLIDEIMPAAAAAYSFAGADVTTTITMPAGVATYTFVGADTTTLFNELTSAGTASYTFAGADITTSDISYQEGFEFDAFHSNAFSSDAFDLEAGTLSTPLTGGAASASYTFAGADVATLYNEYLSAGTTSYSFAGADVTYLIDEALQAATDTYAFTGADVTTSYAKILLGGAGVGTYTFTGQDVTTVKDTVLLGGAAAGSYTFTGADITYLIDEATQAAAASYALTGADVTTAKSTKLLGDAGVGSYAFTGQDVTYLIDEVTQAAATSYTFTGADATTTTNIVLTAGVDSYTFAGADVTTLSNELTTAGTSSYTLTYADASLSTDITADAGTASYAFTGADATTSSTFWSFDANAFDSLNAFDDDAFSIFVFAVTTLTPEVGTYAVTGADANLEDNNYLSIDVGAYTFNGVDINTGITTPAAAASYTLTGADVTTVKATISIAGVGTYTLTGKSAWFSETLDSPALSYTIDGRPIGTVVTELLSFDYLAFSNDAFWVDAFSISDLLGDQALTAEAITYALTYADAATISPSTDILAAGRGDFSITAADAALYPATGMTAVTLTVNWQNLDTDSPFYGVPALADLVAGDVIVFDSTTTPDAHAVTMSSTGVFNVAGTVLGNETFDYFIVDVSQSGTSAGTTEQISVLGYEVTTAGVATYTLTGADIATQESLIVDTGVYTFTGADVSFTLVGNVEMTADPASYTLTGSIALTYKELDLEVGTYSLTGADVTTQVDYYTAAGIGTYILDGTSTRTIDPTTDDWIRGELLTNVWIEAASTTNTWTPGSPVTTSWTPDSAAASPTWTSDSAITTTWTEKDVPD